MSAWTSTPPHSPPPGRSFQGVKATVTGDSYMNAHNRAVRDAKPLDVSTNRPFQGVKATVPSDNFLYAEIKKNKENMASAKKRRELKPHVGGDSVLLEFARKQQSSPSSTMRNQFAAASFGGRGERPHVGADSIAVAAVRVTKAQTPADGRGRTYQGVKANVGTDSFHMAFINSMRSWSKPKANGHEVRL